MADQYQVNSQLRASLSGNLSAFNVQKFTDSELRMAAVALVVTGDPENIDCASLILTRRPARLNQHAGQFALPGGKLDPGESVLDAARRELHEELGLDLPAENILGRLDDYTTRSGFCIAPVVIWGGNNVRLIPSKDEVEEVFYIPFDQLDGEAIPLLEDGVDPDRPVLLSDFPVLGTKMYSPTAAVIYQFREVAIRGRHTRVAHFDQPRFAWR